MPPSRWTLGAAFLIAAASCLATEEAPFSSLPSLPPSFPRERVQVQLEQIQETEEALAKWRGRSLPPGKESLRALSQAPRSNLIQILEHQSELSNQLSHLRSQLILFYASKLSQPGLEEARIWIEDLQERAKSMRFAERKFDQALVGRTHWNELTPAFFEVWLGISNHRLSCSYRAIRKLSEALRMEEEGSAVP